MTDSIRAIARHFTVDVGRWETFFLEKNVRSRHLVEGYLSYVRDMAAKSLPPIFEGVHLATLLGLKSTEFGRLTNQPEAFYRSFEIQKRAGGFRTITVPSPLLLRCQQWIDWFILRKLQVHPAAHGYVSGKSNISNARFHCDSNQIMSVDIASFFESVTQSRVIQLFHDIGYPPNIAFLLSQLCCYCGYLPQGGASSPQLSNLIMLEVDENLHSYCEDRSLKYTRYVDDITISGRCITEFDYATVESILENHGYGLNRKKTRLQRGHKKVVTGLSISSGKVRLPREMRRRYKNEAFIASKRAKNFSVELAQGNDPIYIDRILGKLAYWRSAEDDSPDVENMFLHLRGLSRLMTTR